ncbi:inactive all-trans-retinol 13,14-reductase-like [Alosa alosa]|uniref:inactive all-trans-retinol 13,14-reductase-like n=1 Tax=Alosa alosa TaxID=278164 RepID=UPI002015439E|nr:inactive all-trans-retinol 13,14-reductase-like [Alosa alosa]
MGLRSRGLPTTALELDQEKRTKLLKKALGGFCCVSLVCYVGLWIRSLTLIMKLLRFLVSGSLACAGGTHWYLFLKPSLFSLESLWPTEPLEVDQKKRNKVPKKGFSREKIPENLDAIVIGSGLGGLTTAACMAKKGKRVLVLEQHDTTGGCCHTFTEKGFEFDVDIQTHAQMMKPGKACVLLFCGFDGTAKELDITPTTLWLFKENDIDKSMDKLFAITFPSAKDPASKIRHPGKSCMTVLTMVNYEWFEEWKDSTVRKRGDDYTEYKNRFADHLFNWACEHFPKIKDKVVYQEIATPLSNEHYLRAFRGPRTLASTP